MCKDGRGRPRRRRNFSQLSAVGLKLFPDAGTLSTERRALQEEIPLAPLSTCKHGNSYVVKGTGSDLRRFYIQKTSQTRNLWKASWVKSREEGHRSSPPLSLPSKTGTLAFQRHARTRIQRLVKATPLGGPPTPHLNSKRPILLLPRIQEIKKQC